MITPLGLTNAQYSVLAPLLGMERRGVRPSQRQLADFTGLEPLYVSKLARSLEQAGLLERAGHPDDSRAVQLSLTDRGRDVAAQATARVRALQDELTAPLGGLASPATAGAHRVAAYPARSDDHTGSRAMTTTPTLTGQDIGQAEKAPAPCWTGCWRGPAPVFHGWVILNQLSGPAG